MAKVKEKRPEGLLAVREKATELEAALAELPREEYQSVPLAVGNLRRECRAFVIALDRRGLS